MSLRRAINEKCKDCTYHPSNGGTWRQQVAVCSCSSCPLWPVRPAPHGVDVPRDPVAVPAEWLRRGHAEAIAALRSNTPITSNRVADSAPFATDRTEAATPAGEAA